MLDYDKMPPSKQPKGSFPYMLQQAPRPMPPRPITAKENYRRALTGETPMWMPVWLYDTQYCWPDVVAEHAPFEGNGLDWWGAEWVWVETAGGQMVKPGTRVISDITKWREEITIPNLDAVDFEGDAKIQTARYDPNRMHLFHSGEGLFERLHEMMPVDETLIAFYEEPEEVLAFFSMVCDYKIELFKKIFEYYAPIDFIIHGDDWGTQRAGFFSNAMFREMIMPHTKRLWDFVHSTGRFIELHSCGLTQQYIEEIIEMGCDAWTPQAINDFDMLTEKYGKQITLTVPIPGIMEAKTADEARKLVREFVDKYAPRGRIVAGSIMNMIPEVMAAATDELYEYSSAFYAAKRAAEGK